MNTNSQQIKLSELLGDLVEIRSVDDRSIAGISLDSRDINKGELFIALPGTQSNGNDYIEDAINQGAITVVYEDSSLLPGSVKKVAAEKGVILIPVAELAQVTGYISSRFYGEPTKAMHITAITGTNGKTTCSLLLAQCLQGLGLRSGVIGTLGAGFPGEMKSSTHTTPDAVQLQRQMADLHDAGADHVVMEVSSHGLHQGRVAAIDFNVAVFTNLTRDHLDYHGSMQQYGAEKARLFYQHDAELAIINSDDEFGQQLLDGPLQAKQVIRYGIDSGDVRAAKVQQHASGMNILVTSPYGDLQLQSKLMGRFNAYNLLACASVLLASGYNTADIARVLSDAKSVPGRMEVVMLRGVTVVIDFAHTPDALKQALQALGEHISKQRMICVFGCGGDRDQGKRPEMGAVAEQYSDVVIVTDDNPRHEKAEDIRSQIIAGMKKPAQQQADRRKAIYLACQQAKQGDILLIAGKGHEQTQQLGELKTPFNDLKVVTEAMASMPDEKAGMA